MATLVLAGLSLAWQGANLYNPRISGTTTFTAGEYVTFADGSLTWGVDNANQIGTATARTEDVHVAGALKLYHDALGTGDGNIQMKVWNGQTSGDIAVGDVVVWDEALHELGADTTAVVPFRITFDISSYGGLWYAKWTHGGTSDADTVVVVGTDVNGDAQTESLILTGGASIAYGTKLFATITSATAAAVSEAGTQELDALLFRGVKAADGGNQDVAGVAVEAITDEGGTGMIVIQGIVKATVDAGTNNAAPGSWLIGASGGDAAVFVAAAGDTTGNGNVANVNAGKLLGYALQSSAVNNTQIWIWVDRQ